jgi:hypothetical protein
MLRLVSQTMPKKKPTGKLTLGFLERLSGLGMLHPFGTRSSNWRRNPFLRVVRLDGAQRGLVR